MARSSRSSRSMGTRSPIRPSSIASRTMSSSTSSRAMDMRPDRHGEPPRVSAPRAGGDLRRRPGCHRAYQGDSAPRRSLCRPTWPMIILRTPKGWTGPKEVDGVATEGRSARTRSQWPMSGRIPATSHLSRSVDALLSSRGFVRRARHASARAGRVTTSCGARRMSANPHANGGLLLRDLRLPDHREYAVEVERPAAAFSEATRVLGLVPARCHRPEPDHLPPVRAR